MKAENKAFLDANREHYTLLVQAGIIKHLDQATRESLLRIIREEFAPNYIASTWCSSCVADILKFVYVQYDKYLEANPEPVKTYVEQIMEEAEVKLHQGFADLILAGSSPIETPKEIKGKRKRRNQSK